MNLEKMIDDRFPKKWAITQATSEGYYIKITYVAHWRAWCSYNLLFPGQSQRMAEPENQVELNSEYKKLHYEAVLQRHEKDQRIAELENDILSLKNDDENLIAVLKDKDSTSEEKLIMIEQIILTKILTP